MNLLQKPRLCKTKGKWHCWEHKQKKDKTEKNAQSKMEMNGESEGYEKMSSKEGERSQI